jgi:hypothetical protein
MAASANPTITAKKPLAKRGRPHMGIHFVHTTQGTMLEQLVCIAVTGGCVNKEHDDELC